MASNTTALSVPFNMSTKPSSGDELDASRRVVDNSNFDAPHIATLPTPEASKAPLQFTSSVSRRGMALVDDDEVADPAQDGSDGQTSPQGSQGTLHKRSGASVNTGLFAPIAFGVIVVVCGLSVTGSYLAWRSARATSQGLDLELNQRSAPDVTAAQASQATEPSQSRAAEQ